MGGSAERATAFLKTGYRAGADLAGAVRLAVEALGQGESETRSIPSGNLEVACLDRSRVQQRKFRRVTAEQLGRILGNGTAAAEGAPTPGESTPVDPAPTDPTPTDPAAADGPPPDAAAGRSATGPEAADPDPPVAPPIS